MNKERNKAGIILAVAALLVVTLACQVFSSQTPAPAPTSDNPTSPTTYPEPPPATTVPQAQQPAYPAPEATQEAPAAPAAESTGQLPTPCAEDVCVVDGVFVLQRPIGSTGRNTIDTASRYGVYQRSVREAMHGVKFLNTTGIPVLAAADGVVVVAGDDLKSSYGPATDTYGNLVILRHDIPDIGQPVFTLYGQLSEVSVEIDQNVSAGDEIGKTGSTGRVQGSTLSFEVRLGENNYGTTRNPELWLKLLPHEGSTLTGAIAGRVVDVNGKPIHPVDLQFELLGGPGQPAVETYYLKTYADRNLSGNSPWEENFALAGIPPGRYQISFYMNGLQQREVEVMPGKLTLVNFSIP